MGQPEILTQLTQSAERVCILEAGVQRHRRGEPRDGGGGGREGLEETVFFEGRGMVELEGGMPRVPGRRVGVGRLHWGDFFG